MPHGLQIIPYYAHPHVHTVIFDHSWYDETVATPRDPDDLPYATCLVTGADTGIDNVFVRLSNLRSKVALFGRGNFEKYGQSSLQADQLFNGQTNVWYCRVMPDDATYANMIVLADFRQGNILDHLNQETGLIRMEIKFRLAFATKPALTLGPTDDEVLREFADGLASTSPDPDNDFYMTLPLFYVRSIGRGIYGNRYSMRLTRDVEAEREYRMKMYRFTLLTTEWRTRVTGMFTGSLYQTTRYEMSTLISDVMDQFPTGFAPVFIYPFEENFLYIYNWYRNTIVLGNEEFVRSSGTPQQVADWRFAWSMTADEFDPIFGFRLNTRVNESIPYYRNYTQLPSGPWVAPQLTMPINKGTALPTTILNWPGAQVGDTVLIYDENVDLSTGELLDPPTIPDRVYEVTAVDRSVPDGEITYNELTPGPGTFRGIGANKPLNTSQWSSAFVGARVLMLSDPENNGARWMYTVMHIDPDNGNIVYNDGHHSPIDASLMVGENLQLSVGHIFDGGFDGEFGELSIDGTTRPPTECEMKLLLAREYVKAFRGEKDRKILSPARVNLDFIFDANYNMTADEDIRVDSWSAPLYHWSTVLTDREYRQLAIMGQDSLLLDFNDLNVKKAMYDLNEFRNKNGMTVNLAEGAGCLLHLDCNLTGLRTVNVSPELIDIINMMEEFDGRQTSIDLGYYEIFDPVSTKRIKVTATYFIAMNLVPHIMRQGLNKPFVYEFATLRALRRNATTRVVTGNFIRDSFRPDIDLIDWDVKERLFTSRINYWETEDEGRIVMRACQNTRQRDASALLEESNVRVLNTMKKMLERACKGYLYEWNEPEARQGYTDAQMEIFRPWIGTMVHDMRIYFTANDWEQERMIMRCWVEVAFRDIIKRIIVEINVTRPATFGEMEEGITIGETGRERLPGGGVR